MIEVRNLCKNYGDRPAIKDLNFTVKKGEVVGFLGPNGAGKTTTMKIITGYMAPSSGVVNVSGHDVFEEPLEVKSRIGYLPETPPVYGDMYVEDYLVFVANLRRVRKEKIKGNVRSALEKTNLHDVKNRLIQHLSKGYKQRVGLAQALVSDPEILILDEPTVGLDPKQVAEMRALIHQLKGQHTLILSTHILPEVQATCQRVIIINQGRIVAENTLEGLSRSMTQGRRLLLKVKRSQSELLGSLSQVRGVRSARSDGGQLVVDADPTDEVVEAVAQLAVQKGCGLLELKVQTMDLEDIFIKLTSNGLAGGAP